MIWDVRLAKAAAKQLEKLPRDYQTLLLKKLNEMRDDPFQGDVQPLKGKQHKGRYRKRVGRYRIIFTPCNASDGIGIFPAFVQLVE